MCIRDSNQSERGGREGRGRGGRGGREGRGRGHGRGGRGQGDGEKEDDVNATSTLPYKVYKDLPAGFKKWMKTCRTDKRESSDGKPTAVDRQANQAETVAPSTTNSIYRSDWDYGCSDRRQVNCI